MLEIKKITVRYGENPPVLEDFSLLVRRGEIVAIVGESGSGKTTVIRAVLGNLPGDGRVTKGDILFEGRSLLSLNREEWRRLRGTQISMIFQDSGAMMNPTRSVGAQFVEYIRAHSGLTKNEAREKSLAMLSSVRLPDPERVMKSYPFELSGGMRQRVGIAMALTFRPKLLLADEPTSALDVTTQAQIVRQMTLQKKESDAAMILITHNLALAAYMSDHIIVLKDGKVVDSGSRDHILRRPESGYTKNLLAAVPAVKGARYV
ncbi:MAG: ABC transporter ATP-binding protein [Bacillota bacterium]|jgi:peptide/nickel transport system ATP-binding protein